MFNNKTKNKQHKNIEYLSMKLKAHTTEMCRANNFLNKKVKLSLARNRIADRTGSQQTI